MPEQAATKTEPKATSSKKAKPVGTVIDVDSGVEVIRPDGSHHTIDGTQYVLDVPGVHLVGDTEHPAE